jgi:glycosyltransferase involved in cell wall biosynthesis
MTRLPAVSVILPSLDRLEYLRPAVESVFAQSFQDWELLIADDGSGPQTLDYLRSLESRPQVRLLRLTHCGNPSRVRNTAVGQARGSYLAFMDSDDLWLPRKLEVQIAAHHAEPQRGWSYTALRRIAADGELLPGESTKFRPAPAGAIIEQLLTLAVAVATPSVMVERSLMLAVGGFDEQQWFFEEYDLWLRLNLRSDVIAVAEPLTLVRNHEQHYSADRAGVYQARFRLLDRFSSASREPRFEPIVKRERARTAAKLAAVHAAAGRRAAALQMLWRSREEALRSRESWRAAVFTAARAVAPAWVRRAVRGPPGERVARCRRSSTS